LRRQIGNIETILEPARRDTFPAVALAAGYLRYVKNLGEDDVFLACPIDPFAEKAYFELLAETYALAASGRFNIGLLGVEPTYPSEKYGYIRQAGGEVSGFVEKPDAEAAQRMIDEGALWNCGVFALKIGYVLEHARKYAEFESFEQLHAQYGLLPKISFDYEVVEKESSIGVVSYGGVWKDLGTWNTLTEEMGYVSLGDDVLISESSTNTHVLNMLGIPIIAQDIKDAVVVASHDGILVSSKPGSSHLKPLADKINLRPMYEQQQWGNYRVLEYKRGEGASSLVRRVHVDAGQT
jgi:mannose-1-phosphate guanylyltransferase